MSTPIIVAVSDYVFYKSPFYRLKQNATVGDELTVVRTEEETFCVIRSADNSKYLAFSCEKLSFDDICRFLHQEPQDFNLGRCDRLCDGAVCKLTIESKFCE